MVLYWIMYIHEVVRFFFAIVTLGASTSINGGLKDSSHEHLEVIFDCEMCNTKADVWTYEFGLDGKQRIQENSNSLTFGDVRACFNNNDRNFI